MLFQVFSILFLIAQCAAVVEYIMVTKSPSETEMMTEVLSKLNDPRRSVAYDTHASNLHLLTWDVSLAWLAFKASATCEDVDNSDGFTKLRFRLSIKKISTEWRVSNHTLIHDLWINLDDFAEHINDYGANITKSLKQFSKFYDYFRSDWTRIGCAFKVCKGLLTGEDTNLVCYLGPKTIRDGPIFETKESEKELCQDCKCDEDRTMCKEQKLEGSNLKQEEFQKKILDELNGARSKFALKANASSVSKLVWDDNLANSAMDAGSKCPNKHTPGSNYREVSGDLFWNQGAGLSEVGDMYGTSTIEETYKEVYDWTVVYTILWPKMTKVGCARTPNCANKVWCHFGDIGLLEGRMFERGTPCSKCKSGCEEGLCT